MFNFKQIASVASSALMIGSTVALAAAANYPAPFVQDGQADVAIVTGQSGSISTTDTTAAIALSNDLATALAAQGGSSGSTSAPTGGDFVKIERSSDRLNLGNTLKELKTNKITSDELGGILADETYQSDDNQNYDYTQYLELGNGMELKVFDDDDYKEDTPSIGIPLSDGQHVLNYTLDFDENPISDVTNGRLTDLEHTDIQILGRQYTIFAAYNSSNKYELMGGSVRDTLQNQESKSYTAEGKTYQVTATHIGSGEARFTVNGENTGVLDEGETYRLSDGTEIGVIDTINAEFSGDEEDVEFALGASKLTLENGQEVKMGDTDVDGLKAYITKTTSGSSDQQIEKIVLEWRTDDEEFVAADSEVVMPGFESVKLYMSDFVTPTEEVTELAPSGNDRLELTVPVEDGSYTLPLLYSNGVNFTVIGKDSSNRLRTTIANFVIFNKSTDDYLVASYADTRSAESYILDIDVQLDTSSGNRTTIRNKVTGDSNEQYNTGKTFTYGDVELTVAGFLDSNSVNLTINSGGNFSTLYTKDGLKIYLPFDSATSTARGVINISGGATTTPYILQLEEEDKDGNLGSGGDINLTSSISSSRVTVSSVGPSAGFSGGSLFEIGDSDVNVGYFNSSLATYVEHDTGGDQDSVELTYHGSESYGEVYLAESGVSSSGSGGALGNIVVSDSQVDSVSSKNLIVVGGSCINTVAARLMGADPQTCGPNFTSRSSVGPNQFLIESFNSPYSTGKVAVLVAGYEAIDTQNAATYLRSESLDMAVGQKFVRDSAVVSSSA